MGPFPVGVRTITWEDPNRRNADGQPRKLVTEIWYPATSAAKGQPGASYSVLPLFTQAQQAELAGVEVPVLETTAVRDAALDAAHGPFPLVVFSHGQAAIRWQSTYLTVTLASHGYIVASPDHEGGTLYDVVRGQLAAVTEGIDNRPLDVGQVISNLINLKDDPLAGMVQADHIGVAGHSFGALTALRAAPRDHRIKAIVPQAPTNPDYAFIGLPMPVHLGIPVMIQGGGLDHTLPWEEHAVPTWAAMEKPRWLLELKTAGHFTFSDLCGFDLAKVANEVKLDIPGADVSKVLGDGCGGLAPPASVAQPMINHFTIGFFNATLRGSQGSYALLTQESAETLGAGVALVTAEP